MIPLQTIEVLLGAFVASSYAAAVVAIGVVVLWVSMDRQAIATICSRVGLFGFLWFGFVMGQGILAVIWLMLSFAGVFYSPIIWIFCAVGWFLLCAMVFAFRRQVRQPVGQIWAGFSAFLPSHSWYFWVGSGIVILCLLRGVIALLPPSEADALHVYLLTPRTIAFTGKIEFQPFASRLHALQPLQVEMHWAALFAISNETAVTVWDYFCALSFLSGIGLLAQSLTSSKRVALLAVLMMLSTPAFYSLMGGGRPDNASAQYGIAAFLWLVFWRDTGRLAVILAGLCAGWVIASRYANLIVFPGLILFAVMIRQRRQTMLSIDTAPQASTRDWISDALVGCVAAGLAFVPMLIKNWLLVECPLAPEIGCQGTFWTATYRYSMSILERISKPDLLLYPFLWTFADRNMLGNISPMLLGFLPFFLIYHGSSIVRSASLAGLAGLASVTTWLLMNSAIFLNPRWFLVSLGLFAVPLSASVLAAEQDLSNDHKLYWLVRGAIVLVLFFSLFEARGAIYGSRYLASTESRTARYQSRPEFRYDVAAWLDGNVPPGQRIALSDYGRFHYLLSPRLLLNSERAEELQWLWEHRRLMPSSRLVWTPESWGFLAKQEFTYVVLDKDRVDESLSAWPKDMARAQPQVPFVGQKNAVLRIER